MTAGIAGIGEMNSITVGHHISVDVSVCVIRREAHSIEKERLEVGERTSREPDLEGIARAGLHLLDKVKRALCHLLLAQNFPLGGS